MLFAIVFLMLDKIIYMGQSANMRLRDFVIEKMDELKLNRSDFGTKCGVSYGTITNIVEGRSVGLGMIAKIARAFSRHPGSFIEWDGPDNSVAVSEESPGFGISSEEQRLLDVFRDSKTAKLAIRELLNMSEDERLQWVLDAQDKAKKGD